MKQKMYRKIDNFIFLEIPLYAGFTVLCCCFINRNVLSFSLHSAAVLSGPTQKKTPIEFEFFLIPSNL